CHSAAKFDGLDGIEAVVGIEHETRRWPDRLAHRSDQLLVRIDVEADLELDCRKALSDIALNLGDDVVDWVTGAAPIGAGGIGPDLAAQRPAHQHMDRRLEVATLEIPERDVDARERRDNQAFLPLVTKAIVEMLPVELRGEGVRAYEFARHRSHHSRVGAG